MKTAGTPQRTSELPQWMDEQENGLACVMCGFIDCPAAKGVASMPVGHCDTYASLCVACASCCGDGDE